MQATELLEADNLCRRADLMEGTTAFFTNRARRAGVISFARNDENRLRALQLVSAFEFGERAVEISASLHLEDVAKARAAFARAPYDIIVVVLALNVIAEYASDIKEHLLNVAMSERSVIDSLFIRRGLNREARLLLSDAPPPELSDSPMPASRALNKTLIREKPSGALHEPAPRARSLDFGFNELRKVGDEAAVEKTHVLFAACGDEFLQNRKLDARGVWIDGRQANGAPFTEVCRAGKITGRDLIIARGRLFSDRGFGKSLRAD